MKLFKSRKNWTKPFPEKVARRVSRIPSGELSSWSEQALNEIGRCLSSYSKTQDPRFLDEALVGAEALHAVVDELYSRFVLK